jgi:long-chain fatty acid transport protein
MRLAFLLLALPLSLYSGGFQVNLQSQKNKGMGHTGTALLSDASVLFFNPGGMSLLDSGKSFVVGGSFIIPYTLFRDEVPSDYSSQTLSNVGTPFSIYFQSGIRKVKNLTVGFGVYTPFGSRSQWPDDWKGQFIVREINLKTIFLQPTASWKLSDEFSVGAGPVFATGKFGLRKGIPVQDSAGFYGEGTLEGGAKGFGFNTGLFYKGRSGFSAGISFRSPVKVSVNDGTAEFIVPESLKDNFPNTSFSTSITLPYTLSTGIAYRPDSNWIFTAELNYVGWNSYDSLRIHFTETTDKLKNISSARMYKNAPIARIGVSRELKKILVLRAGAYYDFSPVLPGYLTPETPDANKLGLTFGTTIKLSPKAKLDLSFLFVEGKERTDKNLETQFSGTYKSRAFIPGLGFEFRF